MELKEKFIDNPTNNKTEKFLTLVAHRYADALLHDEEPITAIVNQTGASKSTVVRWVALARKVGILV